MQDNSYKNFIKISFWLLHGAVPDWTGDLSYLWLFWLLPDPSSTSKPANRRNQIFVFSGYSATAVSMLMPSSQTWSFLTPVTACSLSCASSENTLPDFSPLNRYAKDLASPGINFSNGLLFGKPISGNGLVCCPMPRLRIPLFWRALLLQTVTLPSPWNLSGWCPIPSFSHTKIPYWQLRKTHGIIRPSLLRIFPSSDHTTMGWRPAFSSLMIRKTWEGGLFHEQR